VIILTGKEKDLVPDEEGAEESTAPDAEDKYVSEEPDEKADKYLANWQRAEADFVNYKRRVEQERADLIKSANASLITDILPVLDDFERAVDNAPDTGEEGSWGEGIRLIYRKLKSIIEDRGVSEIEAEGKEFDPNIHEAVICVEGEDGKCIEELQKGYMLGDRLLRPSMVKVGRQESPGSGED